VSFPPGTGPLIALNPGHNGGNGSHPAEINRLVPADRYGDRKACDTTGTNTNGGYPEHEFNWDVTLRVRTLLRAHGVRVILTRPNDTGVGPCVDARAAIGNEPGVAAVISIHADGAAPDGHGFHVCEDSRPPAGAAVADRSHRLTVAVHDALLHGSGLTTSTYLGSNGYFPRSDLAGLNLATVPATFLELGNMRNAGDAALQTSALGRHRIAVAVAAGILGYLGRH
jgi:N-acetylmuramoyl-L-alanine amidase